MHPIRVGLAAYGMSGQVFHGPLLRHHPGFSVKKILERNTARSKTLFPDAEIVRSYPALLKDPEIDLIVVNTPDMLHHDMAREALVARKHVIVEKPFTMTVEEGRSLIHMARLHRLMLTVFQNRRWDSDFLTMQKILEEGYLGRINEFESHFDRYRTGIASRSWKEAPGEGTGVLYNLGSHMIDQAIQLFGTPRRVFADLRICRENGSVTDYFSLYLYYGNLRVLLKSSYLVFENSLKYAVHGIKGSYVKRGTDRQESDLAAGLKPGAPGWGEESEDDFGILYTPDGTSRVPGIAGNYLEFYNNIHAHLHGDADLHVRPEESLEVIRIIELALKSHHEGCVVNVP
jgi:predicted dehydrogenase